MWGVSLTHPILASLYAGSCLAYRVLTFYFYFLSSFLFSFIFYLGNFSYTSRVCFFFLFFWGIPLTHPVLASFLSGEFLLHIPRWLHFYAGCLLYISCWLFLCGEFHLHIPCCLHFYAGSFSYTSRAGFPFYQLRFSYTSHAGFIFIWGIFLTHPMLALFFCGEFLWHIPCRLLFLIRGVSLTHPVLFSFSSAESLLNIPCCFIFIWGVSLTHPMLI